jgi:hypothetical protein
MVEVVGLKLVTHHPVIEPVSAPRRERKFPMQRQAGESRAHHLAETESETRRERESPHFRAISARRLAKV